VVDSQSGVPAKTEMSASAASNPACPAPGLVTIEEKKRTR
jgi:hypothetical protein